MKKEKKEIVKAGGTPEDLIRLAVDKGADLDKLEKVLMLKERWDKSEALKAYNASMALFKANPPKIDKDKTVKYKDVKYNHASLYNVVKQISVVLSKYGLSATWKTQQNADQAARGAITVVCKITHEKGHSEETMLTAQADKSGSKNDIQAIGSTITYLQRYTLLTLTGLATADGDDDGQAAGGAVEYITDKQHSELTDLIIDSEADEKKFCEVFKIGELAKMSKADFQRAKLALVAKKSGKMGRK